MMSRRIVLLISAAATCALAMTLGGCSRAGFSFSVGVTAGRTTGVVTHGSASSSFGVAARSEASAQVYRYYPADEIYYCENRGVYFWRNSFGKWTHGPVLPTQAMIGNLDAYERVTLHVDDPTMFHSAFARAFPANGTAPTHSQSQAIATVTDDGWPE